MLGGCFKYAEQLRIEVLMSIATKIARRLYFVAKKLLKTLAHIFRFLEILVLFDEHFHFFVKKNLKIENFRRSDAPLDLLRNFEISGNFDFFERKSENVGFFFEKLKINISRILTFSSRMSKN